MQPELSGPAALVDRTKLIAHHGEQSLIRHGKNCVAPLGSASFSANSSSCAVMQSSRARSLAADITPRIAKKIWNLTAFSSQDA
jgi:hypothetical protein